MEKHVAHYSLEAIKDTVTAHGIASFTHTAQVGVELMGLTMAEAIGVVLTLERRMLIKSMTTYADHTVWQDVYNAPCPNGKIAYIKLTLQAGRVVIQFKEK